VLRTPTSRSLSTLNSIFLEYIQYAPLIANARFEGQAHSYFCVASMQAIRFKEKNRLVVRDAHMEELANVDPSDMAAMVASFPLMLKATTLSNEFLSEAIRIRNQGLDGICIVAMGGSAIAGEICKEILADSSEVPILCIREYILPKTVNRRWVVIAVSYSGNTEETIAAYKEANRRECSVFVLTTGGILNQISNDLRKHMLPPTFQPRAALPIILAGILPLLETLLNLEITNLPKLSVELAKKAAGWEQLPRSPKEMAHLLKGKIPLLIGWRHLVPVAYRAKCQFNENSKVFAAISQIPEIYHNEIEGTRSCIDHPISPVFLRSQEEDEKTKMGIESAAAIFQENGCHPEHLNLRFDSRIEEALGFTMYLDMVSVRLAEILGVNPLSVERIAQMKRRLRD